MMGVFVVSDDETGFWLSMKRGIRVLREDSQFHMLRCSR